MCVSNQESELMCNVVLEVGIHTNTFPYPCAYPISVHYHVPAHDGSMMFTPSTI